MAYVTLEAFRNYIGVTSTTDDAVLQDCLESAQSEIEGYCGRTFEGSTGTRYYRASDLQRLDGPGGSGTVLWLSDDLLALGGLTNGDGTTIASTDVWTEPRNQRPYQYLRLKTNESWYFDTDGEITVSGTWGYSTSAPADIVQAVKEHAKYIRQLRRGGAFDEASPEGAIIVSKGFGSHVRHILENSGTPRYVRKRGLY